MILAESETRGREGGREGEEDALGGQPSPGTLQSGQQPSNATRQMPHTSSSSSSLSDCGSCGGWASEVERGGCEGLRFQRHMATAW